MSSNTQILIDALKKIYHHSDQTLLDEHPNSIGYIAREALASYKGGEDLEQRSQLWEEVYNMTSNDEFWDRSDELAEHFLTTTFIRTLQSKFNITKKIIYDE